MKNTDIFNDLDDGFLFSMNDNDISVLLLEHLAKKERDFVISSLAKLFIHKYNVKTLRDEKTELWVYKDGVYVPYGETYVNEFCSQYLGIAKTPQLANLVIDSIRDKTFVDFQDFFKYDATHEYIALQNGLFNLKTSKLEQYNTDIILFNKFNVCYDENADCPAIKKFINDILMNKNDVDTIQEMFGWLFYKIYKFEKIFMFLGDGRNGKSKLVELIKNFVGANNTSEIEPHSFEDPDGFMVANLFGKLANLVPDIEKSALKRTSKLKQASGNDVLTANRKFKNPISFRNCAKLIFGANSLPFTYDTKDSFWERFVLIEFPYKFTHLNDLDEEERQNDRFLKQRDDNIIDKLITREELNGLFNWAYQGYKRLEKNKRFSYRYTPQEVKNIWISKTNSFVSFAEMCLDFENTDAMVSKKDMRSAYKDFCNVRGLKMISDKQIGYFMESEGIDIIQKLKKTESESYNERYWVGVAFKKEFGFNFDENEYRYTKISLKDQVKTFLKKHKKDNYLDFIKMFGKKNTEELLKKGFIYEPIKNTFEVVR